MKPITPDPAITVVRPNAVALMLLARRQRGIITAEVLRWAFAKLTAKTRNAEAGPAECPQPA